MQRDIVNPKHPSSADVNCPQDHTCSVFITAAPLGLLASQYCVLLSSLGLGWLRPCSSWPPWPQPRPNVIVLSLAQYLASLKFADTKRDNRTKGLTALMKCTVSGYVLCGVKVSLT